MSDLLHKIITSVPIDTTAAKVTSESSIKWTPKNTAQIQRWETCPPIKTLPPDLTGKVFGQRMTVMGLWAEGNGKWVVRCSCGYFETRSAKAICNPKNYEDCCHACDEVRRMKRKSVWKQTGIQT